MSRALSILVRILLAVAGIGYIIYITNWTDHVAEDGTEQPGILTMLRTARWGLLITGLLLVALVFPVQSWRWYLLMRARGMEVTFGRCFNLTLVGTFFNFCMPGTTGGDLVKAYYAAKRSDRRADAVMSVLFDRITGMLGLIALAGLAGLFMLDHEAAVVRRVPIVIWALAAGLMVGAMLYFSVKVRRTLRLGALVAKLPGRTLIRTIDAAAIAYRDHKAAVAGAIGLSIGVHMVLATAAAMAGYAVGMSVPWSVLLAIIPVIFLAGAVPLTYQGLGLMEGLAAIMLVTPNLASHNEIVAMLLFARLYQIVFGLLGATLLLKGDIHLHPGEPQGHSLPVHDAREGSK